MILVINLLLGAILIFVVSQMKKLRENVRYEIFCGVFYLLEIIECMSKRTVRIYVNNSVLSVIMIILAPFVIFFVFYVIKGMIESKNKHDNVNEE